MMKRNLIIGGVILAAVIVVAFAAACANAAPIVHEPLLSHGLPAFAIGGLILNRQNLATLTTSFRTTFNQAFSGVSPSYGRVAMTVPSTTSQEQYGWLNALPRIREWIGDRVLQNIGTSDFTLKNKDFEGTLVAKRPVIEDDQYGIYTPIAAELGRNAATFPDELVWPLLTNGFASLCYDGQNFFDTDHPVLDENGQVTSVANTDGGAGTPWFLLDTSRMIKPLIFQNRKAFQFVALTSPDDDNVFRRNEYVWGVDGRCNAGYGLWQLAWGSKQTLDATHYEAARAALGGMKGDYGKPLGIMPNLLVVGPSLEGAGRKIVNSEVNDTGASNPWKGTAELLVVPWLA